MNELALFAGAGGGILGGHLLGWRTVCAVEWEPYAACVLAARQNDGVLPPFPIWDDVQTFDGRPWRGIVQVVSGGFPCQDISAAGKGAGIDGERSGMWREMARIVYEVRPRFVFVENSPMLTSRGLGTVLGDLAALGFDARWGVLGAADVGAPHQRDRIWIVGKMGYPNDDGQIASKVGAGTTKRGNTSAPWEIKACQSERPSEQHEKMAYTNNNGLYSSKQRELGKGSEQAKARKKFDQTRRHRVLADADGSQRQRNECSKREPAQYSDARGTSWWHVEPDVGRVANGVAARVDRLKAIGNGQVPRVAAAAWEILGDQR